MNEIALKLLTTLTLIVAAFVIGAHGQTTLTGSEWTATYVRGAKLGRVAPLLRIDDAGSRFTGNTGCNIMNGTVRITGSRIAFSTMITTKRFCTRETAAVEQAVLTVLNKATRFSIVHDRMTLYSGRTSLARLERHLIDVDESPAPNPTDQLSLEDRKWFLESVGGRNIPKTEQEAFINFDPAKNSVGGDTSCNVFGGDYKTEGSSITISQVISTMRACVEDQRMNVERDFLEGLRQADRYRISADKLSFYHRDKLLLTFVGRKK